MFYERTRIVFWPVALDARYEDVAALDDGEIDATFINGALRLTDHVRMARLLRKKSKCLIAHGACAQMGGRDRPGQSFHAPATADLRLSPGPQHGDTGWSPARRGKQPRRTGLSLPGFLPAVLPLDRVVTVEACIPGCPPPAETMAQVIEAVIAGHLPPKGTVYAHRKALCHGCPRIDSRPQRIDVRRFKRLHETLWDPDICFLPQGLICLGPVTRGGCNARCIGANMPCRGCFGPTERMDDFGAGAMALIAALMADGDEADHQVLIDSIADPTGLFYRYSLATSVLGKGRIP